MLRITRVKLHRLLSQITIMTQTQNSRIQSPLESSLIWIVKKKKFNEDEPRSTKLLIMLLTVVTKSMSSIPKLILVLFFLTAI